MCGIALPHLEHYLFSHRNGELQVEHLWECNRRLPCWHVALTPVLLLLLLLSLPVLLLLLLLLLPWTLLLWLLS